MLTFTLIPGATDQKLTHYLFISGTLSAVIGPVIFTACAMAMAIRSWISRFRIDPGFQFLAGVALLIEDSLAANMNVVGPTNDRVSALDSVCWAVEQQRLTVLVLIPVLWLGPQ